MLLLISIKWGTPDKHFFNQFDKKNVCQGSLTWLRSIAAFFKQSFNSIYLRLLSKLFHTRQKILKNKERLSKTASCDSQTDFLVSNQFPVPWRLKPSVLHQNGAEAQTVRGSCGITSTLLQPSGAKGNGHLNCCALCVKQGSITILLIMSPLKTKGRIKFIKWRSSPNNRSTAHIEISLTASFCHSTHPLPCNIIHLPCVCTSKPTTNLLTPVTLHILSSWSVAAWHHRSSFLGSLPHSQTGDLDNEDLCSRLGTHRFCHHSSCHPGSAFGFLNHSYAFH